jgi:hypothetical protein
MNELATSVIYRLEENSVRAAHNPYNFEVLLVLTKFMRHHARMFLSLNQIEENLKDAESAAAVGNAKAAVESLLFAHAKGAQTIHARENAIQNMKEVFAETRVPGYLTREDDYFKWESTLGMESWMQKMSDIILEYTRKNNLDAEPIARVLKNGQFVGEATGE